VHQSETSFRVEFRPLRADAVPDYLEFTVQPDGSVDVRGFDGRLVVRGEVANKLNIAVERF
jgi:hypothetical protein